MKTEVTYKTYVIYMRASLGESLEKPAQNLTQKSYGLCTREKYFIICHKNLPPLNKTLNSKVVVSTRKRRPLLKDLN